MTEYSQHELNKRIADHEKWLEGNGGCQLNVQNLDCETMDLRGAQLRAAYLPGANFKFSSLTSVNLEEAYLINCNFSNADMRCAGLSYANCIKADLSSVSGNRINFDNADLSRSTFRSAVMRRSSFVSAGLGKADLTNSDFKDSNFTNTSLAGVNHKGVNFSGATGIPTQTEFIEQLESTNEGIICYKQFDRYKPPPSEWIIEEGSIITETVNGDRATLCGCGVNVAKRDWGGFTGTHTIWQCLIRWEWLPGVVVPYNTKGKFRTERLQLMLPLPSM